MFRTVRLQNEPTVAGGVGGAGTGSCVANQPGLQSDAAPSTRPSYMERSNRRRAARNYRTADHSEEWKEWEDCGEETFCRTGVFNNDAEVGQEDLEIESEC